MPLEYALSKRGVRKLVDNGSMFVKDGQFEDRIKWKCDLFNSSQCKARVHTVGEEITRRTGEHNHAGNAARVEIAKMMETIIHRAQTTSDLCDSIVSDAVSTLSPASVSQMTNIYNIKRVVQRVRNRKDYLPPLPDASEDFVIADEFRTTECGEQFLLVDHVQNEDRYIIFSTEKNLRLLSKCHTWLITGSFNAAVHLINKVVVILGLFGDNIVPMVYTLMLRDSVEGYNFIFSKLKQLEPMLQPKVIFGDFDVSSYEAIGKSFSEAKLYGCFFQFCQIYFKSIQMHDMQQKFESDPEFALKLKLLPALAFISTDDVIEAFEQLTVCTELASDAFSFVEYFEDCWIGKLILGKARKATIFPISYWNCAEMNETNIVKLNYIFENWHRGFTNQMNVNGANIWKFLKFICTNQAKTEAMYQVLESEDKYTKIKLKYPSKKLEIVFLKQDKSNHIDYLKAIASALVF